MNLPIRGRYEESGEHLAEAVKHTPKGRETIWVYVFVAVFSVGMACSLFAAQDRNWFIFLFLFPIYFLVMSLMNSRWSLKRKYFAATGRHSIAVTLELDQHGFRTQSESGIKAEFPWSVIEKCVEKDSGILVFTPRRHIHWIPKNAFESPTDFAAAVALARANVSNFTPV